MMNEPSPSRWSWTPRNVAALLVLTAALTLLVGLRLHDRTSRLNADLTINPAAMTPAADTVDPNTAPWASLARLPGIGPSRAQAICDYRQAYAADHGPAPAFATAADLAAVPGIGEVTVERIAPYLAFGAAAALRGEAP